MQREAEGPRASMDYSEFPLLDFLSTKKKPETRREFAASRFLLTMLTQRTGQRAAGVESNFADNAGQRSAV